MCPGLKVFLGTVVSFSQLAGPEAGIPHPSCLTHMTELFLILKNSKFWNFQQFQLFWENRHAFPFHYCVSGEFPEVYDPLGTLTHTLLKQPLASVYKSR